MQRKIYEKAEKYCPECGSPKKKNWDELSDEEKFVAERKSAAGGFSSEQTKRHRFCARCLCEDRNEKPTQA